MWILKKSVKRSNFQERQGKGWRIATLLALFVQISFSRPKVRRKTLTGSVRADFENPDQSQSLPSSVRLRLPFLMEIVSVPLKLVSTWQNIGKTPIPPVTLSRWLKFAVGLDAGWKINFCLACSKYVQIRTYFQWQTKKEVVKHAVFATACRNHFYGEVKHFNALPNFICMFSRKVVDDF